MLNPKLFFSFLLFSLCISVSHANCRTPLPYDASQKPDQEIQQAIKALNKDQLILLSFGANWCKDCRVFNKALCNNPLKNNLQKQALIVKVDIGQWDHNLDIVKRFGNPVQKGIPAIVIIDQQQRVLAAATGGELASARSMSEQDITAYLKDLLKDARQQRKTMN